MTEEEWLACKDPFAMLRFLQGKASDRKLRLFACACCRRNWRLSERAEACLELAECHADGLASIEAVGTSLELLAGEVAPYDGDEVTPHDGERGWAMEMGGLFDVRAHEGAVFSATWAAFSDGNPFGHKHVWPECCDYVRCLFGNPIPRQRFRRVRWLRAAWERVWQFAKTHNRETTVRSHGDSGNSPPNLAWRTSTAVTLASQMYESRDFGAMPILADALQDAGCDNEDVLNHCRGPGPHVRGCWVIDLVLGKQ